MKIKFNNKYVRWGLTAFLVLIAAITFCYFMFNSNDLKMAFQKITKILMPVVVGMAIAYLLSPMLNYLEQKVIYPIIGLLKIKESAKSKKIVRTIAILITSALVLGIIYMLIYMIVSQIVPSVQNIIQNYDSYTKNITQWINKLLEDNWQARNYITNIIDKYSAELENKIKELLPNTVDIIKTVSLSVLSVLGSLWNFVIGFIISIYVLANKENFAGQAKKGVYALFEMDKANVIIKNLRFTHRTFIGFLGGKIVDSVIIGILCFIGTTILKLPYAALVSVIIGCTNIIPFFGPFLGAIPSALLIFMVDPMHPLNVLYFVIFVVILQQIDGNIIGPKILGGSTGLTGFWVIFSITLFGGLFGVLGMVIGIPFFAVIYAGIRAIFNDKLLKKELPIESSKYVKLDYIDQDGMHDIVLPPKPEKKKKNKKTEEGNDEISDTKGN